jgi:farnesyl diphosphate synthase
MESFETTVGQFAQRFDALFEATLTNAKLSGPGPAPHRLLEAMRHGSLEGGKRLRPLLVAQTAELFGLKEEQAFCAGLAVEMVHCYSLIHDDLPAMDDDDLRRGRPTVHKAYDDATAILAGDALLTHAFAMLANPKCHADPIVRSQLVLELAQGAGAGGMVGGQMRDLEGERGGFSDADIAVMQDMKTGALIRASVRMGAILGGANDQQLAALTVFGEAAGRAFQLADDILDVTATAEQMGKATNKDSARSKPTLVAKIGVKAAERHLGDTIHKALSALAIFEADAVGLRDIARYFAERGR